MSTVAGTPAIALRRGWWSRARFLALLWLMMLPVEIWRNKYQCSTVTPLPASSFFGSRCENRPSTSVKN